MCIRNDSLVKPCIVFDKAGKEMLSSVNLVGSLLAYI